MTNRRYYIMQLFIRAYNNGLLLYSAQSKAPGFHAIAKSFRLYSEFLSVLLLYPNLW